MGIIRQFLKDYGFIHHSEIIKRRHLRAYAAANMGRLTADWISGATSIDSDIRSGLVAVRDRARDLSQNNEYAKAYLRSVKKNVVGSKGFTLQVKAQNFDAAKKKMVPDKQANDIIEKAFQQWSAPEFATVTGKLSLRKVEEIAVETAARDGEHFIRIIRGNSVNKFGFTLQFIEPDYIDEKLNKELPSTRPNIPGNIIRLGVELDPWRRPVAYHIIQRAATLDLWGASVPGGPHIRVPASDIIHLYDPERSDQTRGVSWMAPAMLGLHNLKGYIEGAIINARAGANKLGFFRDPDGLDSEGYTGDSQDATGRPLVSCDPGSFEDIGRKEFVGFDPKYPDGQFDPFTKTILRGISVGLGLAYSSVSNDQREASWSSLRTELGEEREGWKMIQSWLVETLLNRVFSEWLFMALTTGVIKLPMSKYEKFNSPQWTGRRWYWVDPLKEVQSNKEALAAGLKSATALIAEDGGDIEDLYQQIADEQALAEEYGLTFDYGGKKNGTSASAGDANQESAAQDGNSGSAGAAGEEAAASDDQPQPGNGAG